MTIGKIVQLTQESDREFNWWKELKPIKPKVLGIIQARSNSKRLSGKIFKKIGDKIILEHCICNCMRSRVDFWVLATAPGTMPKCSSVFIGGDIRKFQHSEPGVKENDVLGRFVAVSNEFPEYEWIVRITADSPFVDPKIIDETIEHATKTGRPQFDYFNEGSCVAVFRREDLLRADKEFKDRKSREHVCECFRKGFEKRSIDTQSDLNRERRKYELLRKSMER